MLNERLLFQLINDAGFAGAICHGCLKGFCYIKGWAMNESKLSQFLFSFLFLSFFVDH
jgi:hypothetical protein